MQTLNEIIVIGRVGRDPELRHTKSGVPSAFTSVATDYRPKDGDPRTDWHNIIFWGDLAERAMARVKKGVGIWVRGRMRYRSFETEDGQKKFQAEIVAERFSVIPLKPPPKDEYEAYQPTAGNKEVCGEDQEDLPF